jgi:hypothetical protein
MSAIPRLNAAILGVLAMASDRPKVIGKKSASTCTEFLIIDNPSVIS